MDSGGSHSGTESPARDLPGAMADLNASVVQQLEREASSDEPSKKSSESESLGAAEGLEEELSSNGRTKKYHASHLSHRLQLNQPHDNLKDTVFLRAEAIPEQQMKAISVAQFVGQTFAIILLVVEVVFKYVWPDKTYLLSKANEWWNATYAVFCFVAVVACLCVLLLRVVRYRHKLWGRRRKVLVSYNIFEAVVVLIALACIIIPDIYVLSQDCTWFGYLVRICAFIHWTCWNTLFMIFVIDARNINFWKRNGKILSKHGRDRIQLDAPIWVHASLGVNWLIFEAVNICLLVINSTRYSDRFTKGRASERCNAFDYNCRLRPASTALQCILFASWLLWILLWFYYIFKGLKALHQRPWHKYKMANTILRVQIKARLYSIFVMGLCLILLVFVKINSCASYVQTWLGLGPMAAVETATLISNMYFYMPKSPDLKEPMIQAMLQEFVWSEEQRADRTEQRRRRMQALGEDDAHMPLFSFQTAIKSFYFAALIYEYQEDKAAAASDRKQSSPTVQGYSIEKALELYNLERFELLVEPAEDTKVLLCWNTDTVHLSFRGTASMTNVLADLQVWMSDHPPKRGRFYKRPKVHAGFLKAWGANGLDRRVMNRMKSIFSAPGIDLENMRVLLTGHSLGGALASLAAMDIALEFKDILREEQVMCYTFGAPRTGNHSFARECNVIVPETWNIMNARDIVPRSGKFIHKYKAHGQRVIVNGMGDMLVRPTFVEFSASQSLPFQSRVQDHYLATYQASFIAVCTAQFGQKAFKDGVDGLHDLISSGQVHDVLSNNRLDEKIMGGNWGGATLFQVQNQLYRGVGNIKAGAKGAMGMNAMPPKEETKSQGRIHCHDGVCWRERADDNLHSDSSSLTRSSRDLSVSSKSRSGAPATTRRSTSLKRLTRQSSRAKEEEAAKHAEKDPELGLPDGQETEDAEMGLSGPSGRESPGRQGECVNLGQHPCERSYTGHQETHSTPGEQHKTEASAQSSQAEDPRNAEGRGPHADEAAPAETKHARLHVPHPHLPRFLHSRKKEKGPSRIELRTEADTLYEDGNQSPNSPPELHFSRFTNQYTQHTDSQKSESEFGRPDASRESMGTGKGEGASVDEQQSSGKDSRWSPKSSQLAKASSMSMSSFGSARSFTLEDNLRRMEKQGTLHDAIVAAEAARQKRKEEDRFPQPSVHLADHPSFANMQRIFHHSKTGPASRKHEGLDHSSTM